MEYIKKKRGPKEKEINQDQAEKIKRMSGVGMSPTQIGHIYGIGKSRFYQLIQENNWLEDAINQGRATTIFNVANRLYDKALNGDDYGPMFFFLKTIGGFREKEKLEVDFTDKTNREKITDQEIEERQRLLDNMILKIETKRRGKKIGPS